MAMGMGKNPLPKGMEGNGLGNEIRERIREWAKTRYLHLPRSSCARSDFKSGQGYYAICDYFLE